MYYGFDMGGTKIELAVFDQNLNQLWQKRVATPKSDYQALLQAFTELTAEADLRFGCKGQIGIGLPGIVNLEEGTVFTTNVPAAQYQPFIHDLEHCLQRPIKVDNDANCFALSEAWDNEFRQYPTILGMILGTGVGGGYIINGRAISGKNGITAEIGHLNLTQKAIHLLGENYPDVACGCGRNGCFEGVLSGPGFERLFNHFYQRELSAVQIVELYYAGDLSAKAHVERYVMLLAIYLGNILTLFDPHLLVIGGGLSNFDEIYRLLPEYLPQYLYKTAKLPRIEKARYGDSGGARGAACLNMS